MNVVQSVHLYGNTALELQYGRLLVKSQSFVLSELGYFEGKEGCGSAFSRRILMHKYSLDYLIKCFRASF